MAGGRRIGPLPMKTTRTTEYQPVLVPPAPLPPKQRTAAKNVAVWVAMQHPFHLFGVRCQHGNPRVHRPVCPPRAIFATEKTRSRAEAELSSTENGPPIVSGQARTSPMPRHATKKAPLGDHQWLIAQRGFAYEMKRACDSRIQSASSPNTHQSHKSEQQQQHPRRLGNYFKCDLLKTDTIATRNLTAEESRKGGELHVTSRHQFVERIALAGSRVDLHRERRIVSNRCPNSFRSLGIRGESKAEFGCHRKRTLHSIAATRALLWNRFADFEIIPRNTGNGRTFSILTSVAGRLAST